MPRAASLADSLKANYDAQVELVQSSGGVFEVEVDGNLVFSKKKLGRFPEDGEIEKLLGTVS
ncbi:MAG: SelT/SelW/SelH family protein [Chitinivibrionales bacterium]|nr:SelT/SelW/SelH family protein [Chitinivibrionales bacterium]MBD3357787.1 SelT/SelW/SelH family protein [Chitinivibrionales bacterium]